MLLVVGVLALAYLGAGFGFRTILGTSAVYSHLAYVPLVIAGLWWGKRAVLLAIVFACALLALGFVAGPDGPQWSDFLRAALLIVFALVIGVLSERLRAAQEVVTRSEERYRALVEKSLAGIFVYCDERIVLANSRFAAMVGADVDGLSGRSFWDFLHSDDHVALRELLARRERGEETELRYEARFANGGGDWLWADVSSYLTEYEGRKAVLVNVYDVTEKMEAEHRRRELTRLAREQEEQLMHSTRLAEMGEMAAGVAHELNQPLTGIRNFARNALYMLESDAGSAEEVRENLRLISDQVDRASRIIGQMRELARRSEREVVAVEINGLISESLDFLEPQMRLGGIEVLRKLSGELPPVLGDRVRLEQVFLNLLANARQAMDGREKRRLEVETRLEADSDCPVVAEIRDSGRGFTEEEARNMFKPFYSTKKAGQGTGLGLSISLKIVEDHGGRLNASGQPDNGAVFIVRLPAADESRKAEDPKDG